MKITTLKERIEKAKTVIEKKGNTIAKKEAQIEKKYKALEKLGVNNPETRNADEFKNDPNKELYYEIHSLYWDIKNLKDDIRRNKDEIEEKKNTLNKYELQLVGEIEKENIFISEIPEQFKTLQDELVKEWNKWDFERKENLKAEYKELGYREFMKKHTYREYDFMSISNEKINEQNEKDAKYMIIDLYNRVKDITGEVKSWDDVRVQAGAQFNAVLNGTVVGKEGVARIESILAGGYNIQKLHVRVLVKEL